MRATRVLPSIAVFGIVLAGSLAAQAGAPKDATGQCTDGSYTTAKTEQRGCLKHGGVKTWFAGATSPASSGASPTRATPAAPAASAAAPAPAPTAAPSREAPPAQAPTNPSDVWVNLSTKYA
jgi:hypothetical protein